MYIQKSYDKSSIMRTALTAVLDTQQCDPEHWLGHMLSSHPAYCMTLIEQCVITMKGTVIGQPTILYWSQETLYYRYGQIRE